MQYKYKWNKEGKLFSQGEWLSFSHSHFLSEKDETKPEEAYIYLLIDNWQKHLHESTILLSDKEEEDFWIVKSNVTDASMRSQQKGKEPIDLLIGCTYCHHIHATEADGFPSGLTVLKECRKVFSRRILK